MRISMKILAGFCVVCCVACGAKKSTQSKMEQNQEEMATEASDESQVDNSTESTAKKDADIEDSARSDANDAASSTSGSDTAKGTDTKPAASVSMNDSQLYSKLNMTETQINDLENALEKFRTKQQNMANGDMLGTVAGEKDRILKEMLSEEQYTTYSSLKKGD